MKRKRTSHLVRRCFCLCGLCLLFLLIFFPAAEKNSESDRQKSRAQQENAEEKPSEEKNSEEKRSEEKNAEKEDSQKGEAEPGQGQKHEEPETEPVISTETKKTLDIAEIQAMEAGSVLDISGLEQEGIKQLFSSSELSQEVQQRIWNCSYHENETIGLEDLRYLRVLHMGFDGETHIGELIVNQSISEDVLEIMMELYRQGYPIEKMILIDAYGAEDEASMSDNNTSAFNYREIAGSSRLSKHGMGLAIDINPKYNPCVKQNENGEQSISPSNGSAYADRSQEFSHKIDENDLCFQLFSDHGFTWGGNWKSLKDYQHFEK